MRGNVIFYLTIAMVIILEIIPTKATIAIETIVAIIKHIAVTMTVNHVMDEVVFFLLFFIFFYVFFFFLSLCKDETRLYLIIVNDAVNGIVCILKGIDDPIGKLLCDIIIPEGLGHEVLKASDKDKNDSEENNVKKTSHVAYLIVPAFAIEIMRNESMAFTIASYDIETRKLAQKYLNHITDDAMVIQLGGALKKLLTIDAGIAAGLGNGQSTFAGMITRCVCGGTIDNGKIIIDNYVMIHTQLNYDIPTAKDEKSIPHTILVPTTLASTTHNVGFHSTAFKIFTAIFFF